MARKILAYIDECGAYGFDFTKSGNSPCFIVCAILINEGDKEFVDSQLTNIRNKYFSGTEIKSNHIKGNHKRRIKILSEVIKLPFTIVALVVDKTTVFADYGITKNKKTFYKFINQLLYNELRGPFANLTITSDEVGENDFCREFLKYVQVHRKQISLFDQEIFSLKNSKEVNGVQLADLIAGTLSYIYDANKKKSVPQNIDYFKILTKNISNIAFFPQSYDENMFEHKEGDSHYSQEIAMLTYRKAKSFIDDHQKSTDEDISRQVFVLRYLMFRFKYYTIPQF